MDCQFCKTSISEGAEVCVGCGARKAKIMTTWGWVSIVMLALILFITLIAMPHANFNGVLFAKINMCDLLAPIDWRVNGNCGITNKIQNKPHSAYLKTENVVLISAKMRSARAG